MRWLFFPSLRFHRCMGVLDEAGPAWDVAWLPSASENRMRAIDDRFLDRLGLIAAARGDGSVIVYALPDTSSDNEDSDDAFFLCVRILNFFFDFREVAICPFCLDFPGCRQFSLPVLGDGKAFL